MAEAEALVQFIFCLLECLAICGPSISSSSRESKDDEEEERRYTTTMEKKEILDGLPRISRKVRLAAAAAAAPKKEDEFVR